MLELLLFNPSAKLIFKFWVQFFVASLGYNKKYIGFIGYWIMGILEHLRRRDNRLDVVTLEVLLEVEDGKAVRLREAEELTERGIRLDGLLVRKLVVLCILHDATRDIRAADLSARGEAEEDAEILRDLNRLGEDRRGVGLLLAISADSASLAAAAALGLLLKAGDLLLHLLHLRRELIEGDTEGIELDKKSSKVGDN